MYKFEKLNDEMIEIERVPDDYEPSFWFENERWYLSDFVRVHNNPWLSLDEFPDYIHGMLNDGSWRMYERPLFVELCDDGEHVNVYEEVEQEFTDYRMRCANCFALVAGDNDEWVCDEIEKPCSQVIDCPEGLGSLVVEVEHGEEQNH